MTAKPNRAAYRDWLVALGALALVFIWPLFDLARFSLKNDMYSHILLIPAVSAYFFWIMRKDLPAAAPVSRGALGGAFLVSLAIVIGYVAVGRSSGVTTADSLAVVLLAFVILVTVVTGLALGLRALRALLFPVGFLVFMIPLPTAAFQRIETLLQYGSAATAYSLFRLAGTSVYRLDLVFRLPGISLEVAPECSGLRSTLALFITSIVAGYLFLKSPWKRTALSVLVIPLALLRNGFRVFTLGELCVHISPRMIDSPIHHRGGPVFFALSLVPFFIILYFLMRSERPKAVRPEHAPVAV